MELITLRINKFGWLKCCHEIPKAIVVQNIAKFYWYSLNSGMYLP